MSPTEKKYLQKPAVWRDANAEKLKALHAAYRAANPEKIKESKRMSIFGLSTEAFQLMLSAQKNVCSICKEIFSKEPHVDHCHKTGKVRGLLCGRCNVGLGFFRDSLEILESAKEYLREQSQVGLQKGN